MEDQTLDEYKDSIRLTYNPNPTLELKLVPFGSNGLNENQIQTILLKITKNSYFMSSKKVREFEILNTEYSFANIYKLKTYDQKRKLNECFVQYKAGRLEDETLGKIPDIFEIEVKSTPKLFENHSENVKLPFSESIRQCGRCKGNGKIRRSKGSNREKVKCESCGGNGSLKHFLQLTVDWVTKTYLHISTDSLIPEEKLKSAQGYKIFEESKEIVHPVHYLPDQKITKASKNLIEQHLSSNLDNKPIWKLQSIEIVPVVAVHFKHKKQQVKTFWIYGKDLKVHNFSTEFCSLM